MQIPGQPPPRGAVVLKLHLCNHTTPRGGPGAPDGPGEFDEAGRRDKADKSRARDRLVLRPGVMDKRQQLKSGRRGKQGVGGGGASLNFHGDEEPAVQPQSRELGNQKKKHRDSRVFIRGMH